ncbi:hypothetical protein TgHK011_007369 [Trichoderma gracile]|nr:hypothetical protein TgHK011_007369 [Trichoderma gracile]
MLPTSPYRLQLQLQRRPLLQLAPLGHLLQLTLVRLKSSQLVLILTLMNTIMDIIMDITMGIITGITGNIAASITGSIIVSIIVTNLSLVRP